MGQEGSDWCLRQAIRGVTPDIAVKARRVGGSTHQVPIEIGSTQGKALAIRWLLAYGSRLLFSRV